MPVVCFLDHGVMVVRAGDSLRARARVCSPFSDEVPAPMLLRGDAGDFPQNHQDHKAAVEPLAASELAETVSPDTSCSLSTGLFRSAPCSPAFIQTLSLSSTLVDSVLPPPGLTNEDPAPPPAPTPISVDERDGLPLPEAFFMQGPPPATAGGKQRASRGRQLQAKRLLGKMMERARQHPDMPIEIPPCMSDYMSEGRLRSVLRDVERVRSESAANTAGA